jgi:erythromycin esterase-like protein
MQNDTNQLERTRHKDYIEHMEAELIKLERKRKKLFDDYEDDIYTRDEFVERKQQHTRSIEELKAQIQQAKDNLPEVIDYSEKIITMHQLIDCIQNDELSAKAKNDFLKQYIEDIRYDAIDYGRGKGGKPVLDVILK